MEDRRQQQRHRTLKAGKIVFNRRLCAFDCIVRDLSECGACLKLQSTLGIPSKFSVAGIDFVSNRRLLLGSREGSIGRIGAKERKACVRLSASKVNEVSTGDLLPML